MSIKNKQKVKKILDIAAFVAFFLFFICSLLCLIARFNGARFSLFGNRYDVVLTNSMAEKNPEHAEFLKDDNNQMKAFDLVISRELPAPEEIKTHDVVIYTDRYVGTNMHRVVDVDLSYYERVEFNGASQTTINGKSGVVLNDVASGITTNDISFKTMFFTTYSTLENIDNFNIFSVSQLYTPEITRTPAENGGYYTTYKISKNSEAPGVLKISHRAIYDYSKEYITEFHIDSKAGVIDVNMGDLLPSNEDSANLLAMFNKQFIYEIRGDAAKTSDGWYSYDELQSIVVKCMPGMGYPIRFMGSIWGGLMFGLLGLLIIVADIIMNKLDKKEKEEAANSAVVNEQEPIKETPVEEPQEQPKEEPKPIEQPKVEEPKPEPVKEEPKPSKSQEDLNKQMAELKAAEEAAKKAEESAKQAEARARAAKEEIQKDKPEQPARVNGRFVSKKAAPAKPASNSSRWTKENNPSVNKKRAEGGQK